MAKNPMIKMLAQPKLPVSLTYNRAYAYLVEKEKKRVKQEEDYNKGIEEENSRVDDKADHRSPIEITPYTEPSPKEVLSTAAAYLAMEEFLDPMYQSVINAVRKVHNTNIEISQEEVIEDTNYPEASMVRYEVHFQFPQLRVGTKDDVGEDDVIPGLLDQTEEVREMLMTTGFNFEVAE